MKADEMTEVLRTLALLWPNADVGTRYAGGMAMMCADASQVSIVAALQDLARSGREFPPPPGVVRKWVDDRRELEPEEAIRALGYRMSESGRMRE